MGKYDKLKGRIPEKQTPRDATLIAELEECEKKDLATLTREYRDRCWDAEELATRVKTLGVELEAREILIRQAIDGQGADSIVVEGRNWSSLREPIAQIDDPTAAIKYFNDNGMADLLLLNKTELTNRIKTFVKDEASNGELTIVVEKDPATGEDINVVRSKIPGVKVFLLPKLGTPKFGKRPQKEQQ